MKKYISIVLVFGFLFISNVTFAEDGDIDPNTGGLGCISLQNNLRRGSKDINTNGEVSLLQDFMQSKGLLSSDPTGYFGLLTFNAVKSLQTSYGLSATGYVGALTRLKIKNETCGTSSNSNSSSSSNSQSSSSSFTNAGTQLGCYLGYRFSAITGLPCITNSSTNTNTSARIQPPYTPIVMKPGKIPKVMFWWGKVNQHTDENGDWQTDPNGVDSFAGASVDKLTYCKYFFPNTISIKAYDMETISTWHEKGNVNNHTSRNQSYECVQSGTPPTATTPSIFLTAKSGTTSSTSALTIKTGEQIIVSGIPINLKGPNYGTDFTAAWFFDPGLTNTCTNTPTTFGTVWSLSCTPAFTSSGNIYVEIYQNGVTYTSNKIFLSVINTPVSTLDKTKRISVWSGKVNQHVDANGAWQTDPNGFDASSGANVDKLAYCKKFYPDTVLFTEYKIETIGTWRAQGNIGPFYAGTNMSYRCWQKSEVSVTVTLPNGGESYASGQEIAVKWNTLNYPASAPINIIIGYYANDNAVITLAESLALTTNTGSKVVKLPTIKDNYKAGKHYKIIITDGPGPTASSTAIIKDESDNFFSINSGGITSTQGCELNSAPSLTILTPNGGESFTAGQQVTVNWTSCNIPANAEIEFGMQWPFAALNLPHFSVPNTGSAVYTLPSTSFFSTGDLKSGLFYKIGISAPYININGISVYDSSDNWFTINSNLNCVYYSPTTGQPCIKVVAPTGAHVIWNPGTYQVLWQAGSGVANVKISFCYTISANTSPRTTCTDGPFSPVTASGVAGLGQIGVTVPNPHPGNEQTVTGKIRVSDANNDAFYDESDNPVTIISSNFPG